MQPTKQQIETLKEKCLNCDGQGGWYTGNPETGEGDGEECSICLGSGKQLVEIEKEMIECDIGFCKNGFARIDNFDENLNIVCNACKGTGKIPKHEIGDVIFIHKPSGKIIIGLDPKEKYEEEILKLKIISEKGDKWMCCEVE